MELGKTKAKIERYAKENNVDVQVAWDSFFFDEFLHRISLSDYKDKYVFKGGFYLQKVLGVSTRSTMDLDFKYSCVEMYDKILLKEINEICGLNQTSNIVFSCLGIEDIRAEMKYSGKTVRIEAHFFNVRKRFSIDVAIGDMVTPEPGYFEFETPFLMERFTVLSYSIETIIAEKFETLVSRGVNNSRSKDLFDLYLLEHHGYDKALLNSAMINTFFHRGTSLDKSYVEDLLHRVFAFFRIRELYENYSRKNKFASGVTFEMCQESIFRIFSDIDYQKPISVGDYGVELHLVRHGQDDRDKLGGWSDNHLTEFGVEQVQQLSKQLDTDYDMLVASDLARARESASIIGSVLGKEFIYDEAFRETNNGDLRNLTVSEFRERYPGLYFSSLKMDECYPNGESPDLFNKRVSKAFVQLLENNRNRKILLVTHGGVITVILCLVHGFRFSNQLKISPSTGSIIKIG